MQKQRRCHEDRWDFDSRDGSLFPIKILTETQGHGFCPAKIWRDDPATVLYCERLFCAWKTGQSPDGGDMGTMDVELLLDLNFMIRHWESLTRHQGFKFLATLLGGEDGKGSKRKG